MPCYPFHSAVTHFNTNLVSSYDSVAQAQGEAQRHTAPYCAVCGSAIGRWTGHCFVLFIVLACLCAHFLQLLCVQHEQIFPQIRIFTREVQHNHYR